MKKSILGLVLVGVLGMGILVLPQGRALADNSNSTVEALQKQISQLLEMIRTLQVQVAALQGGGVSPVVLPAVTPSIINPSLPIPGSETLTGLLEDGSVSSQMWGRFRITTINGSYAVKGVSKGVDELLAKYAGQRVTIWGQMEFQKIEGGFWGFIAKKVYPEGYGCVIPAKVKIGYEGDDMKVVQSYLATDKTIYPEGLVTGYYGNLTKKAVEKFQEKKGLKKTGEIDDDTYEKLEIEIEGKENFRCPIPPRPIPVPTPVPNQGFKVYSPAKGEEWKPSETHKIAWTQAWPTLAPTIGSTSSSFAPIGAVRITLHRYISCLYPEKSTDPVCMMAEAAPYVIAESTENDGVFEWAIPANISQEYRDAKLVIKVSAIEGGFSGRSGVFEIEGIDDDDDDNKPPVVNGVSGPTTIKVGETGTWMVKAYDPENGSLSYSVLWGDEVAMSLGGPVAPKTMTVQNTATFTHVYNSVGTYTPVFYVTDNFGQQAKTSMSVVVKNSPTVNQPPKITSASTVPSPIYAGQSIAFSWSAYDPDGDVMSWTADWGEGSGLGTVRACSQPFGGSVIDNCGTFSTSHAWAAPGTYNVKVTVSDGKGGSDSSTYFGVVVLASMNQSPVMKTFQFRNGVTSLAVGQLYTIDFLAVDPEGKPVKYTVDFGDGTVQSYNLFAAGTTGSDLHSYQTIGQKILKLTATDGDGGMTTQSFIVGIE